MVTTEKIACNIWWCTETKKKKCISGNNFSLYVNQLWGRSRDCNFCKLRVHKMKVDYKLNIYMYNKRKEILGKHPIAYFKWVSVVLVTIIIILYTVCSRKSEFIL